MGSDWLLPARFPIRTVFASNDFSVILWSVRIRPNPKLALPALRYS